MTIEKEIVAKATGGIVLPRQPLPIELTSPRVLVLYGSHKIGKTTILSSLKNCLILGLEEGSKYVEALKLEADSVTAIKRIGEQIIKEGKPYDYIAVDTISALEELCMPYALQLYKQTPMGSKFTGDNVLSLPKGLGYMYLWEAYSKVISYIRTLAPYIILIGHLKESSIERDGKEVASMDLQLTGKLKNITCGEFADAVGFMYRKDNQAFITFETKDTIPCGSRPLHLRDKTIMISEKVNDNIITYWDKIYI